MILPLLIASLMPAAIPGTVDTPNPLEPARAWLGMGNDNLAPNWQDDDNRTFAFTGGVRFGDVVLVVDDSALTDRERYVRIDELTAALGWIWRPGVSTWIAPSAGVRYRGNLGGQTIQEHWHRWSAVDHEPVLTTSEHAPTVGIVSVTAQHSLLLARTDDKSDAWTYRLSLLGSGLVTSAGEMQGAAQVVLTGMHYSLIDDRGQSFYIGLRKELRSGNAGSISAEHVADVESGLYGVLGAYLGHAFYLGWQVGITTRYASGVLGYMDTL